MNKVFQLKPAGSAPPPGTPGADWGRFGLTENPFPASGVQGNVLYVDHIPLVVESIRLWLQAAIDTKPGDSRRPLALEGTIGAGKTHLLTDMERELKDLPGVLVLKESLVNAGGGRLLLSNLLGNNLRLGEIAEGVLAAPGLARAMDVLPSSSPLRAGLVEKPTASTVGLWLRGARLTPAQLRSVGGRNLEGEGERLRAVVHLLKLSSALQHMRVLVFMLDQLEDLDVKAEVTPLKRARFLTDLRILIDEGLSEGAPIAVCMAWNNNTSGSFMRSLELQYPALASRLSLRVTIPALPQGHLMPFAQAYLDAAYGQAKPKKGGLRLDAGTVAGLAGKTQKLPGGDIAPREWLFTLWQWAEEQVRISS